MNVSGFIDIAIGLSLFYLLLSLIATTVNELIATALKLRASNLAKALAQMLDDPTVWRAFYDHGLIGNIKAASNAGNAPSQGGGQIDAAPGSPVGAAASNRGQESDDHPSYIDPGIFASALLTSLTPGTPVPTFDDIAGAIRNLPASAIRDVLLAQVTNSGSSLNKLRENVGSWFDASMDRLSGAYKRKVKVISLIVGVVIAIAINADSFTVGRSLWDKPLRDQIVQTAVTTVTKPLTGPTTAVPPPPPNASNAPVTQPEKSDIVDFSKLVTTLGNQSIAVSQFPVGWTGTNWLAPSASMDWWVWLLAKIAGLAATAIAISLGAPFWFDLLSKFVQIRGAGPKPKTTT